jgi:three-Cys-motif partner protein
LKILEEYSTAYATILNAQDHIKHVAYIDGFAGAGKHVSEITGKKVEGSPVIALKHKFSHYRFIDLDKKRTQQLRNLAKGNPNVTVYNEDCNTVLLEKIFPTCQYKDFCRALCLLDPYNLNPDWKVIETAGKMRSVEIFHNFMIMDGNMNIFCESPDKVPPAQAKRMTEFWGDESWKKECYSSQDGLFNNIIEKGTNEKIVGAYRERLKTVAKFKYVPEPIPMKNSKGSVMYYLFFASNNRTGATIANSIFAKYRSKGIYVPEFGH